MYKQCRTEQSSARQQKLIEGLLEAMLQQHYDEITVSSLCDRLQISRKSFYRYFSSKEGALAALIDHTLLESEIFSAERLLARGNALQQEMCRIFAFWLHKRRLLDALAYSGLSGVLIQRSIEHAITKTVYERRFLPMEEQFAQEYMLLFLVSGLMSMVIQWHHDGYPQSPEQMSEVALRLVSQPMAANMH